MGRFVRDEKRTYPFAWLTIGGIFAFASFWAVYAELVTRVPWQEHQKAFFKMELEQARQAYEQEKAAFEAAQAAEPLKTQMARLAELDEQKKTGEYAAAEKRVHELEAAFAEAEVGKTFGGSDLDEAYYRRNIAEYARDNAAVEVRKLFTKTYADTDRANEPDAIYADPPAPPREEGDSDELYHLKSEVARMTARAAQVKEAMGRENPPEIVAALRHSHEAELAVVTVLETEMKHRARIDEAERKMAEIRGPADPIVTVEDPAKAEEAQDKARAEVCKGHEDTINCIKWLKLGPIDREHKSLTIAVAKAKRPLADAELRVTKAEHNAEPKLDLSNPVGTLVGPFQIQQIVTNWMDYKRDVDIQQVDRCHTCHMGVDNGQYTDASIPATYRTHPRRDELLGPHPISKFGCIACHQGQGRATDDFAHSRWILEVKHDHERWHYVGDHYWEDPLLPTGKMTKIVIDDLNDTFEVKIGKGKKAKLELEHRNPQGTVEDHESTEEMLYADIQSQLQTVIDGDDKLKGKWTAVVRRIDNRVELGMEVAADAAAKGEKVETPDKFQIFFPKLELPEMLGFGRVHELELKDATLFHAKLPPSVPVRARNEVAQGKTINTAETYSYTPPSGAAGLQIPDDMRSRLIEGLPEIESGCLRCHNSDADLYPRKSKFEYVTAKLAYEKAQAELDKDAEAYAKKHGTTDLPKVPEDPAEVASLAPTLDEGKALFRQLNCTGCHLLEGWEGNRNAGPQLNDISAKVDPKWILTWLRDPRGWRAKTSMPNLWPRPLDPASKVPYAEGSPEYQKWITERTEETLAIASYLYEMSENPKKLPGGGDADQALREKIAGYADVDGADADYGKQVFEAYGCQGCHANVDGGADLPEAWRLRERDIAPTLSNLANKTNPDRVAYWVENPSRYWHGTSMPNLRLDRREAASVAKYLTSLKSEPTRAVDVTDAEVAMVTDPKKRAEIVTCERAGGRKMSRVDCGAKVIAFRGCYGCHQIKGFEDLAPIGPELTGFAKKDISTLDYGYAITDHHMQTTETFAALKVDSPRIFARDRIELKMGDYDASPREIRALVTFIKGMVSAAPAEEFNPEKNETYASVLKGRTLVNDLNCRGCHMIEGRGAEIDGWRLAKLSADPQRRAPFLDGEGARVQPEWLFNFLRNPGDNGIRPWLHPEWAYDDVPSDKMALRMPTFELTPEQWTDIVRYFSSWDKQPYPFEVPKVPTHSPEDKLWALSNMNSTQTGNCLSCHYFDEFPVERARGDLKKMAPNLDMVRHRLRPEWVRQWLLRPHNYLPYTAMTAFFASADRPKDAAMWPKENDPYLSQPPNGWQGIIGPDFRTLTVEEHADLIRDFLFLIPDGATWPPAGQERNSVMVDPTAAATVADAEAAPAEAVDAPGG
ncbi:MAG: c-type cytochrome [Myxococcales bacterium]|nr:c-type cytochrome [Myxococcales bacterium]